jgi:hypothetical protein
MRVFFISAKELAIGWRIMASKSEKTVIKKSAYVKKGGNGGARQGAGRKPFEPTSAERKQVEALSGYGLPIDQIAILIRDGIDDDTLRKHFAHELKQGKAKANGQIGKTLFQKAISGDTTAAIWWSKTQMRWKEVQSHELTGKDGEPIKTESTLDVSKLPTEVLSAIMAAKDAANKA